ncbi:HK97 gp10 family phage protein [Candidatus Omnitrophota bacterium]
MNIKFHIDGVPDAVLKLKLLEDSVRDKIKSGMGRGAIMIQDKAKTIITEKRHVVTGNLRRGIKHKVGWTSSFNIEGVIGSDVPYAPYIEALPDGGFLYPALMQESQNALLYIRMQLIMAVKGVR